MSHYHQNIWALSDLPFFFLKVAVSYATVPDLNYWCTSPHEGRDTVWASSFCFSVLSVISKAFRSRSSVCQSSRARPAPLAARGPGGACRPLADTPYCVSLCLNAGGASRDTSKSSASPPGGVDRPDLGGRQSIETTYEKVPMRSTLTYSSTELTFVRYSTWASSGWKIS